MKNLANSSVSGRTMGLPASQEPERRLWALFFTDSLSNFVYSGNLRISHLIKDLKIELNFALPNKPQHMRNFKLYLGAGLIFWGTSVLAQVDSNPSVVSPGNPFGQNALAINNTPLQLDVHSNQDVHISFSTPSDFETSKIINNCYHVKVGAPDLPWVVTATIVFEQGTMNPEAAARMARMIQVRVNNGLPVRLYDRPQAIITYNPDYRSNNYNVDLIVDPPFDIDATSIRGSIQFHLELL